MALTPRSVFRYFVTDGVPSSGKHEPIKAEIIQLLEQLFGVSRGGWIVAGTLAELEAITPESETDGGVVLTGAGAGYYEREGGEWVFGRGFPDTFARVELSGSGTAQTGAVNAGVSPADIDVFYAFVDVDNTGPLTLTIHGEPPREVVNLAGNPLAAGEWTGTVMFALRNGKYQLLLDAQSAVIATQQADRAEAEADRAESEADRSTTEADRSEAAADVASGAMTTLLDPQFSTLATAEAYSPPAAPDFIRTAGYGTAGDGGGALYKKVATEPTHAGKFSITLDDGVTVVWYEYVPSAEGHNILAFGAQADGPDAAPAIQAAHNALPATGGTILIPQGFIFVAHANPVALETNWVNPANGQMTHTAVRLSKDHVKVRGGGTVKLVGVQDDNAISYVFANSINDPLSAPDIDDITIEIDGGSYAGSGGQWRGVLFVSCDRPRLGDRLHFIGDAGGGRQSYCGNVLNCTMPDVEYSAENISGGTHLAYCYQPFINTDLKNFNEGHDLDKVNYGVILGGRYRNGASSNEIVDSNATRGLLIDNFDAEDCTCSLLFFNGKGNIAPTWSGHITETDLQWISADGLRIGDSVRAFNVAYSETSQIITIGNQWSGVNVHSGVEAVRDIVIKGHFEKVGHIRIQEGFGVYIDCTMRDVLCPGAAANAAAVYGESEDDWTTYPDAETDSGLEVTFGPNFSVDGCNRNAVFLDDPSFVDMSNGIRAKDLNTAAVSNQAAIFINNPDKRGAKVHIDHLDIDAAGLVNGVKINVAGAGTHEYIVGDGCKISGMSGLAWQFNIPNEIANFTCPTAACQFGDVSAGANDERPLMAATRPMQVIGAYLVNAAEIVSDGADYVEFILNRRYNSGNDRGNIASFATNVTGVSDWTQKGISTTVFSDADATLAKGDVLTARTVNSGAGRPITDGLVQVLYLPH